MTNGSLGCSACGATIKIKWAEKTYWNEQQKSGKKGIKSNWVGGYKWLNVIIMIV